MTRTRIALIGSFLVVVAAATAQAPVPRLTRTGNELNAVLPDGTRCWTYRLGAGAPLAPLAQGDPTAGLIFSADGQLLARPLDVAGSPLLEETQTATRAASWDVPVLLLADPAEPLPHFFDAAGNGIVLIPVGSSSCIKVYTSLGHTGNWSAAQTVSVGTSDIFSPAAVMDLSGNITVVFRSGYYTLRYVRYTPAGGWGPCQQIYTTSNFFQVIELGTDTDGNVAVIFDPQVGSQVTARCLVYNAASGTWGSAFQVSPSGYSIMLPTVMHNPAANAMYLVYRVASGGPAGLRAHQWDSTTRTWGPAQLLPGTAGVSFTGAGPGSRLPSAVRDDGQATVFWVNASAYPQASWMAGGIWQPGVQLLAMEAVGPEDFASATTNRLGDTAGIFSCWDGALNHLYVFRRPADEGWLPPENPRTTSFSKISRVRIGYYQGRHAVATMIDHQAGIEQFLSVLFDGTGWLPGFLDIPGSYTSYFSELVSNRGEVLLVDERFLNEISQGAEAIFFRDPHPGDLDCSGGVNFGDINPFVLILSDPAAWQSVYPDCPLANGDINGDGRVNFGDINPFVALLSGGD